MDRNFHTDDFERLLREKSNEFRMYPSKRIWHSVYNNIHPGRKWPSVAMSITLITALLLIGSLNTRNTSLYTVVAKNPIQQNIITEAGSPQFASQNHFNIAVNLSETAGSLAFNKPGNLLNNSLPGNINNKFTPDALSLGMPALIIQPSLSGEMNAKTDHSGINALATKEAILPFVEAINSFQSLTDEQIESLSDYNNPSGDGQYALTSPQKTSLNLLIESIPVNHVIYKNDKKITVIIPGGNSSVEKNNVVADKKDIITTEDKEWIENYALYNRPATKKWANKLFWQMYATPSVVYRVLYNDPNFVNTLNTSPLAVSSSSQDVNNAVTQKPSIGFEAGAGFQYSIFKGVKLKAGLQLNYTRYNSVAFQNTHPVATRLTMLDYKTNTTYEEYRTTPYSNRNGLEAVKLHNETFQISLPMGTDLKLIGNENLQWNVGATIQPTYVIGGKSYLLSSDRRNYVKETSMLNKWNFNAGFETFITYKSNGFTVQIGPQFRTQLFSTNSKKFAIEEKLVNYGLKFGISKTIK